MIYNDGVDKVKRCGMETDVYSRCVGYYSVVNKNWSRAKRDEFKHRKTFNVGGALNVIDTVSVDYQLANKVTPESLAQNTVAM